MRIYWGCSEGSKGLLLCAFSSKASSRYPRSGRHGADAQDPEQAEQYALTVGPRARLDAQTPIAGSASLPFIDIYPI